MSYFAKQNMFTYRKYKLDIWGMFKNTLQWIPDRKNYYSQILRDKKRKYIKYLRLNERNLEYNKKNFYFIIGFKFLYDKYIKSKIDKIFNMRFNYLNLIEKDKKLKLKKGIKLWTVNIRKYFIAKKEILKLQLFRLKIILKIIYLKFLMFKFFKIQIKKKLINFFSFYFFKKKRREKIYFRIPFIYEMRLYPMKKKKPKIKLDFVTLRITKLFYIIYSYRQLKKLCKKAKRQDGIFEQNYLLLMECKLPSFIYRTSFIPNMFESIDFIKASNIWINKKFINFIYYSVKMFDMIGFRIFTKGFIFWNFFKRLRRKAFIFLLPKYTYISVIFFLIMLLRIPFKKEIINPISIDMYRLSYYAV